MGAERKCIVLLRTLILGILLIELSEGGHMPYKRMSNVLHSISLNSLSPSNLNSIIQRTWTRARERRGRVVSDAGYGSRVAAGTNLANAVMARHGLFGIHGPGRRKRRSIDTTNFVLEGFTNNRR
ncbi:hypothetical protein ACF0H5_016038 [Mactra antiquata]